MPSNFIRATKTVLLGAIAAQSIPILASLIIARLYSPSEFGSFSAWLGIVLTASIIVTGRFEVALAVESDGEPRRFALLATIITAILMSGALAIVATLFYLVAPISLGLQIGLVALFLPATFLMAALQTWQSWAAAEGAYRELSWIRISQAFGIAAFQLIVGWLAPNAISLAMGYLMGVFFGLVVAVYLLPIKFHAMRAHSNFNSNLKNFWHSHKQFPLFSLPADVINAASNQLPLIIITSKFGSEAGGLFALTLRVLGAPINLLGIAVLDVFKRSAASNYRISGNCRDDYLRTFKLLTIGALLLAGGILLISEPFFAYAFGESWRKSGVVAVWLLPMFSLRLIASPLSYIFYITGKQHIDLLWQCSLFGMTCLTLLMPMSFEYSVKAYSMGYALLYMTYLVLSYRYSKSK